MTELEIVTAPGPALPIPVPVTAASRLIFGAGAVLMGWAFIESTGAGSATVRLWSGQDAGGTLIAPISLQAGQSTRDFLAPAGVLAGSGVFLEVASGSVQGSVWVSPL